MRPVLAAALCLLVCLSLSAESAADVWVDSDSGSDLNPGTEALPYATISHAVTVAGPGTIYVYEGTYDEA